MKTLIIIFYIGISTCFAQNISVLGRVVDLISKTPLENANVYLQNNKSVGTFTNADGLFSLSGDLKSEDILVVSYLGYDKAYVSVSDFLNQNQIFTVSLSPSIISAQSILVEAFKEKDQKFQPNFSSINRNKIKQDYTLQDIPEFLTSSPSLTSYSESGNGIGYNYLSIRGFDQRRISVSINGIPQNDPEDHNVYWLDFPDLISSSDLIQIQRGSSSGIIGYPAIGGSVNIITSAFANESKFVLQTILGSYNTKKYSAAFSSGLINKKYSFYVKLSQILSGGYREKSWVKFNSYHFSAVRFDDKLTTQINLFGGPISDGLAYSGLPKFAVKNEQLRRKNYSYWEADEKQNEISYKIDRRADEIENFSQPHFEILNDYEFNEKISFNSALFLVLGDGFFDYDGSWSIYYDDYFRLKQNGYDSAKVPINALIRAQVENKQWGWIPRFNFKHKNGNLILGGELRKHKSIHWGSINHAENLPAGVTKEYRYYYYNGGKDIFNIFMNENFRINDQLSFIGEMQLAYHKYKLYNEKYVKTDFSVSNLFFNTKFAVNYKLNNSAVFQLSFARISREPRLKNYYDAAESSGGEMPQFEIANNGSYDFNKPLVNPETMNDFELGCYLKLNSFSITLNTYLMLFENEIVKNGELDRFGQPRTGNMPKTIHQGIELSFDYEPMDGLQIILNSTISNNFIKQGRYFVNEQTSFNLSGNKISGFPNYLSNFIVSLKKSNFYLKLSGKYVGKFFSDNYDKKLHDYLELSPDFVDYSDNVNDAYFTLDFLGSIDFNFIESLSSSRIFIQVNNIFDTLYSANATGKEFYPAADRNFLLGIQLGL